MFFLIQTFTELAMSFKSYFGKDWNEFRDSSAYYLFPAVLTLCGILILRSLSKKKLNLPPGPWGLPIVGYLPFLGKEPHKTLDKLSKKYGNVFSFYLGQTLTVVLGDDAAVKEAFSKPTMNSRPEHLFEFIPDGAGVAGLNDEAWVEQRRFVMKTMKDIGLGRTKFARLVEDEVSDFLKEILSKKGQPIDIDVLLKCSVSNNISSLIFGERLPPGPDRDMLYSSIDKIIEFFSASNIWNFFPRLVDILVKLKIGYFYKTYLQMVESNNGIKKQIEMYRNPESNLEEVNFINDYKAAMKSNQGKGTTFTERNYVANTRALFVGGTDTTKTALTWLFLTMAKFPDVQKKVQQEIDSVVGNQQRATWEDRLKFPYTYAVTMETQRWQTIVPINIMRMASEDTKVRGYDIPKGTAVLSNIWGLHNDARYWKEPEKFIPERFLHSGSNEINFKKESYMPFSIGKRKCLGETVALMETFLYFTGIMQMFDVKTPGGGKPNMDGYLGVTYQAFPQKLCFLPRQK